MLIANMKNAKNNKNRYNNHSFFSCWNRRPILTNYCLRSPISLLFAFLSAFCVQPCCCLRLHCVNDRQQFRVATSSPLDRRPTNSLYCQQSDCKNKNKILLSLVLLCSLAPSSTGCSNTFLAVKSTRRVRAMRTYCQLCGIGNEYISVAGSSAIY